MCHENILYAYVIVDNVLVTFQSMTKLTITEPSFIIHVYILSTVNYHIINSHICTFKNLTCYVWLWRNKRKKIKKIQSLSTTFSLLYFKYLFHSFFFSTTKPPINYTSGAK